MSFRRTFDQFYQSLLPESNENSPVRRNQLVFLNTPYSFATDGSFLIPQLTSFYLKNILHHNVILISFLNNFDHYNTISAKLGINLTSALNENKFAFIDCLSQHTSARGSENIFSCPLIDQENKSALLSLTTCLHDVIDAHCKLRSENPLVVLIDDLSVPVMVGLPCVEAVSFVFSTCSKLTERLAATSSVCVLVASSGDRESAEYRLAHHLSFESDILLTVEGLASGFSKEVHGKLIARSRKLSPEIAPHQEECHFKLEDRGVKLFAIGTATGVL